MPIFISYSHENKDFVQKLAANLVRHNTHVWVDTWELNVGDSIVQRVQDAIKSASALLVVLSKASIDSEWCKRELSAGLVIELEKKQVIVLPLLLEDCDIPIFLKDKLYADFRSDFDSGLTAVLNGIARVTNCNQGRIAQDECYIDWGIYWGYRSEFFELSFTFIQQAVKQSYTVLTEAYIICNEMATNRYKQYEKLSLDWIGRLVIFESAFENITSKDDFRVLLDNQFPKEHIIEVVDPKTNANFTVHIKCSRIGEDTGKNILINVGDYFRQIRAQMTERSRKLTSEEQRKLFELLSKPFDA
jgi:hypothetical protein